MTRTQARELHLGCTLLLALANLSDRQRHAVIGREWRNLSFRQLAAELDGSYQAAQAAHREGLMTLQRLLNPLRDDLLTEAA